MHREGWRDGQREVVENEVQTGSSQDKQGQISKYMAVSHKIRPAYMKRNWTARLPWVFVHVDNGPWHMGHGLTLYKRFSYTWLLKVASLPIRCPTLRQRY